MIAGGLSGFGMLGKSKTTAAAQNEKRDRDAAEASKVTSVEAEWLADRIRRDGDFGANEKALITRMRSLEKDLPASLKALVQHAA